VLLAYTRHEGQLLTSFIITLNRNSINSSRWSNTRLPSSSENKAKADSESATFACQTKATTPRRLENLFIAPPVRDVRITQVLFNVSMNHRSFIKRLKEHVYV